MKKADILYLVTGIAVCFLSAACGADSKTSVEGTSAPSSMSAISAIQPEATDVQKQSAHFSPPRVDVSDDCLAFLMNKHQRVDACESPTTGQ